MSAPLSPMRTIVERIAALDPTAGWIGADMLAQLAADARKALAAERAPRPPIDGEAAPLCVECAFSRWKGRVPATGDVLSIECTLDANLVEVDPVTGHRTYIPCFLVRRDSESCGWEGRLWQPKAGTHLDLEVLEQHAKGPGR